VALHQTMSYDGPNPTPTGFESRVGFTIVLRSLQRLDDVLAQLVESGVSELHGVSFTSSRAAEAEDNARREAIADARRKAVLYAEAAGRTLGAAVSIREGGDAPGPWGGGVRMMAASADASSSPGGIDLGASVRVTFELN
jgi:uncharacterized protein